MQRLTSTHGLRQLGRVCTSVGGTALATLPTAPHARQQARHRGNFKMWSFPENPQQELVWAQEIIAQKVARGLEYNRIHLMQLMAVAIAHYHAEDYVAAYQAALHAHAMTQEHRPKGDSLLYHSAITAKRCALALADEYEAHQAKKHATTAFAKEEDAALKEDLRQSVMTPKGVVKQLRAEAAAHNQLAQYIFWLPRNHWMRNGKDEARRDQAHGESVDMDGQEYEASVGRRDRRTAHSRKKHDERRWRNVNDLRRAHLKEQQTPLAQMRRPVPR